MFLPFGKLRFHPRIQKKIQNGMIFCDKREYCPPNLPLWLKSRLRHRIQVRFLFVSVCPVRLCRIPP